jgi:G:T/U-mismatch repair DNA glycosylase
MHEEVHPWNWYVPEGAKSIIIGTFHPTLRNWSYNFFYPNKNNYFWRIMARIAGKSLQYFVGEEAVAERKMILGQLGIGLSDMGKIIRRTAGSSSDENLEIVEYMDIFRILEENLSLQKIIFTSSTGKSSAIGWFKSYLTVHGLVFQIPKGKRPLRTFVRMVDRDIEIVLLYSTSARIGATISMDVLTELYKNEIDITTASEKEFI